MNSYGTRVVSLTVCSELLFLGLGVHQTKTGRLHSIERNHALSRMDEMSQSGILEGEQETESEESSRRDVWIE